MPKVSVIIPVYGVEKYIERCARSLFEQTLDDIEYIFVNDCTKDRSIEILKEVLLQYPKRQPQTRIVSMSINSGLPTVRKYGIQLATGWYIAFCDSDDSVVLDAYEKLYEKAIVNEYDVVFCDYYIYREKNQFSIIRRKVVERTNNNVFIEILQPHLWSLCSCLIKRNLFINNKIIYPNLNNFEDLVLMSQIVFYSQSFTFIDKPFYNYYYNPNSISKSTLDRSFKRLEDACYNTDLAVGFLRDKNVNGIEELEIQLKLFCRSIIANYTNQADFRKMWYGIYPELEMSNLLLNRNIRIKLKLNYLSVRLGLYPLIKYFYDLYNKFL